MPDDARRAHRLLVAVALTEVLWITTRGHWPGSWAWLPLLAALTVHAALVSSLRRSPQLCGWTVLAAVAVVAVAAAATAPYGSRDLYQYAFYGRMAARLGADPYVVAPRAFRSDPSFAALAPGWSGARSVYGPVFTSYSALGARLFGTSALVARLWFQIAAALALVGSSRRLHREVGVVAAVAVGLSPVLVAAVNGGHNDLLVGWLLLLALGPSLRNRPLLAGALLGVATGVKLSAAPVVLAVAVVAAHRNAWRPLVVGSAGWAAVTVGAYAAGGGIHLLEPLGAVGGRTSRASAWAVFERLGGGSPIGACVLGAAATVALIVVATVAWRWRGVSGPAAATAAGAAACFAAPYVLAWYPATVIPLSGRDLGSRAAVLLQVGASALLLAYVVPAGVAPGSVVGAPVASVVSGIVLAALVIALLGGPDGWPRYRRRRGQPRAGARRRGGVPRLPAVGGVARAGGPGEAGRLPRRGVLGAARPRVR